MLFERDSIENLESSIAFLKRVAVLQCGEGQTEFGLPLKLSGAHGRI